MKTRASTSKIFLCRHCLEGDQFLEGGQFLTEETIINFFDPKTKRESLVWKRTSSRPLPSSESH